MLIKSFSLKHDENQSIVVNKLDELYHKIQNYTPPKLPSEPDPQSIASQGTFDVGSSSNGAQSTSSGGLFKRFFGGNNDNNNDDNNNNNNSAKPLTLNDVSVPNGLYIYGSTGIVCVCIYDESNPCTCHK